ncbi:hypothetical protein HDU93_005777 [Gonapodya sp. JEL0774]|nr:hypothetical protein HDU93_005777 [Gonapodya sp. JEL0774]
MALGDFFASEIRELDLQRGWKYAVRNPSQYQGRRLEYVSWRKWFQQKFHLPTLPPEQLNWARDPNECWLYGPIPCPSTGDFSRPASRPSAIRATPPHNALSPYLEQLNLFGADPATCRALKGSLSRRDLRRGTLTAPDCDQTVPVSSALTSIGSDDRRLAAFVKHVNKAHVEHIVAPMAPISPPTTIFASTPGPSSALPHSASIKASPGPLRSPKTSRELHHSSSSRRVNRTAAARANSLRRASANAARTLSLAAASLGATANTATPTRRAVSDISVPSQTADSALISSSRRTRFASGTDQRDSQRVPFYFEEDDDDDSVNDLESEQGRDLAKTSAGPSSSYPVGTRASGGSSPMSLDPEVDSDGECDDEVAYKNLGKQPQDTSVSEYATAGQKGRSRSWSVGAGKLSI